MLLRANGSGVTCARRDLHCHMSCLLMPPVAVKAPDGTTGITVQEYSIGQL